MDMDTRVEQCTACEGETTHQVYIKILEESGNDENDEFSREPYRITECVECGKETKQRMNNA